MVFLAFALIIIVQYKCMGSTAPVDALIWEAPIGLSGSLWPIIHQVPLWREFMDKKTKTIHYNVHVIKGARDALFFGLRSLKEDTIDLVLCCFNTDRLTFGIFGGCLQR